MSQEQLSQRLAAVGRPILTSGVSKIESGGRSVDVDDLVALALALGVNPSRLLLPDPVGEERVSLAPSVTADGWHAWLWADGLAPLPDDDPLTYTVEEEEAFEALARPFPLRQLRRSPLVAAVRSLMRAAEALARPSANAARRDRDLSVARRRLARLQLEFEAMEEEGEDRG